MHACKYVWGFSQAEILLRLGHIWQTLSKGKVRLDVHVFCTSYMFICGLNIISRQLHMYITK